MTKTQPQLTDIPDTRKDNEQENFSQVGKPKYASSGVVPAKLPSVVPVAGPSHDLCNPDEEQNYSLSFWQAFGFLGIPTLLLLVICIWWTFWLIALTLVPNETANILMNTSSYDNGLFWLIVEDSTAIKVMSMVGLVTIELFYLYLLAKLLVWRTVEVPLVRFFSKQGSGIKLWNKSDRIRPSGAIKSQLYSTWTELTEIHGRYRKYWNLVLKVIDLIVELIALQGFMNDGFPPSLVYGWAGFISINSLSCALNILVAKHSALTEILVDSVFDLVAAVVYPIGVLWYCQHNFSYNHEITDIYIRAVRPNSYDNMGRIFSDQAQIALFRVSFDSLRIQTILDLFLRISMNLSFCSRFRAVVNELVNKHRRALYPRRPTLFRIQPAKQVQRMVSIIFFVFSGLVIAYTHIALKAAWTACSPHPECVVYVQRFPWTASTYEFCPCQALVDENLYVVAWEQWETPVDVTDKVRLLAAAGELRLLRLINRQLPSLPEELRGCNNLQHLSLLHTLTETIPDWASEWSHLEYLHIEGYPEGPGLSSLPAGLFQDMPSLTLIYLSDHTSLKSLPGFNGTPNLRNIVLASLPQLQELPLSFDTLSGLTKLVLFNLAQLERIPDMAPLSRLIDFAVIKPSHLCCNGFLDTCDQTSSFCTANPENDVPMASCIDSIDRATEATRAVFRKFADSTCYKATYLTGMPDPPTKDRTDMCGYAFFRRCEFPPNSGQIGICMPYRMRVLSCTLNKAFMQFRRMEYEELGISCDPVVEDWLGCTDKQQ